ncbi:tubulin-tyrosine ligase family protein, putative [Ichthyophthirius multifiliis]|uniref:Tubulin-tyrosine ligase family protein, putative n=1 Tax=Ichthyophthirius multifiliis TaxID=5932 RepID=G0QLN8_ICHMU|nr:tubulin-tyrosine ligase family protein, putative [Ichthyophthirius multifiliis]EGR33863.1 tubulin-tyrosine ligase family protein, putative [Ichthyophthirius multifiliis]|eukprot:XP_004039087.1 tubulin-tyrosine ligase family protein, putative [Ichthyophthirius multifiliis]
MRLNNHQQIQNKYKKILLDLCIKCLNKLSQIDPQYNINGYRNIWIVKPNFLSRGRGIKCFNDLDKIFDYIVGKETQYVVQKYIERPLLISNKKFDLRQWVIIQNFCPPKIWFFEECYLRFCSVDHNIDDLNNKFVHLTNNVIQRCNKDGDIDKDDLMWRQDQFAQYLKQTNNNYDVFYEKIQPKMKQIVINSLKSCKDQVGSRKNSMELVGYDFMIDSNQQPWLIEINSSPSMDYSTSITKDLVQRVLTDTVKVVVDYSMAKKGTKKLVDTGGFKIIYKGEKNSKLNPKYTNNKK